MEREEYDRLHALERDYWWFRGKRAAVRGLLSRAGLGPPAPGDVVLDVGCGTGLSLSTLAAPGLAVGLDDHAEALAFAREAGARRLVRGSATALPFRDGAVDRALLLDVVEHVPDDAAVLAEVRRILAPGGVAVIHVPAHPGLWSPHDEAMHHARRYTRAGLAERLRAAGLETLVLSWTFAGILAPAAVVRWWKARRPGAGAADFDVSPGWADGPLAAWHRVEAAWLARRDLPFGLSLGTVVRRADG